MLAVQSPAAGVDRVDRVVALDGDPSGLHRHTVRWLLLVVEAGFYGLIALVTMSLSGRHQRLGDMAASTIVVRAQPYDQLPPPPNTATWPPSSEHGAAPGTLR